MTTNTSCIRCKWKENPDNARYEGMACTNPTVLERYNADTGRTLSRMYIDQARPMFCRGGLFEETELAKAAAAVAQDAGETTVQAQATRPAQTTAPSAPLTATIPVAQLLDIRHALVNGAHLDRLFLLAELLETAIERATGKPFAEVQG